MTESEALAFWTELQRAVSLVHVLRQPPAWRRRRCGEMRVTITERRAMQAFHLLNGDSYGAIARRFRRDRHYVRRWVWDADYTAFRVYLATQGNHDREITAHDGRGKTSPESRADAA